MVNSPPYSSRSGQINSQANQQSRQRHVTRTRASTVTHRQDPQQRGLSSVLQSNHGDIHLGRPRFSHEKPPVSQHHQSKSLRPGRTAMAVRPTTAPRPRRTKKSHMSSDEHRDSPEEAQQPVIDASEEAGHALGLVLDSSINVCWQGQSVQERFSDETKRPNSTDVGKTEKSRTKEKEVPRAPEKFLPWWWVLW